MGKLIKRMELEKKAALSVDIVPWYSCEKARGNALFAPKFVGELGALYFGGESGESGRGECIVNPQLASSFSP